MGKRWGHCVCQSQTIEKSGERGRIRTCDPCLKRALLYQLSYAPVLCNQALAAVIPDAWERMGTIISITFRCAARFIGMSP